MALIETIHLSRLFGTKRAVDDVSFSVDRGEILAFIGPNGAGKSTTMRMITGFLPPSSGGVRIDGIDMTEFPVQAKSKIGYLPENAPLYSNRTVTEFLSLTAELHGLYGDAKKAAVASVIEKCQLEKVRHQTTDTLSKGYCHRTCLAQSLIHNPPILVLDEPTDGLDPNQKREIRNLIREMGKDKAIIVSTHILEEVEVISTRVVLIDRGGIVFDGTKEMLFDRYRKFTGLRKLEEIFHHLTTAEVSR